MYAGGPPEDPVEARERGYSATALLMKPSRRRFVKTAAGLVGAALAPVRARAEAPAVTAGRSYDVAVIGAGAFGAWTAHHLRQAGRSVALIDAYGPATSRASSGGHTR